MGGLFYASAALELPEVQKTQEGKNMSDLAACDPQPAAPTCASPAVDLSAMTREEFVAAHRGRMFRPKGKQTFYVLPADREPYMRHAHPLPLMFHGKLRAGVTVDD